MAKSVTIYHNPKCSTSRQVLELIVASGAKPVVVEYLKAGWTKPQLKKLFADAGLTARQALRNRAKEAEELGLLDSKISDAKLIEAMIEHPVLVERPFVVSAKGALLARPKERVREIL
ncbi:MAG: arsenate reductase (glutaredoxin) [Hyphomonadaceae bacterium]|nr:arsenate reductase (glutaredoxin) [Hyphomonadaceae bacterium]